MHLPSFWLPFLLLFGLCFTLAWRDDYANGPHLRTREDQWTPLYRFLLEYMVRLAFVAVFCAMMQVTAILVGMAVATPSQQPNTIPDREAFNDRET